MENPIRVLHIVLQMSMGGVQAAIMNYYRNIDRRKVQFDFVVQTEKQCEFDREIMALGGILHRISPIKADKRRFCKELEILLRNNRQYQIIHAHLHFRNIFPLYAAKRANVRTRISHCHSNYRANSAITRTKQLAAGSMIRLYATDYFACSASAGKMLHECPFPQTVKSRIIRNAINVEKFKFNPSTRAKIKNQLRINGKHVLIHVGMFRPCKNHEYLIKIFREFHKLKNNSLLLLIGEGETRKSIEKLVCNYNLEKNVLFLGVRENVSEYLAASDYFIFPSKSEGLPLALIEAQASGIPCFVSDALTRESNLWGLVNYLSIKSAPQVWVKKIINHKQPSSDSREKAYRQIPGFGYDIETEACELENFYLEIITGGKT